jgi:hypothetical protein
MSSSFGVMPWCRLCCKLSARLLLVFGRLLCLGLTDRLGSRVGDDIWAEESSTGLLLTKTVG